VGYADRIVWPLRVTPLDPTKPVTLRLAMHYGVCKNICVPGRAELSANGHASAEDRALVESFVARVPRAIFSDESVSVAIVDTQLIVTLSGVPGTAGLIIEGPRSVWFGAPNVTRTGDTLRYVAPIEMGARATLIGADMRLTFLGENDAIETSLKVQ
jgi:DsbC/DsbD-like thiol-disulfide interchange protein